MNNTTPTEKEASCGSCNHWQPIASQNEELEETKEAELSDAVKKFGKCRRNPPTMLVQDGTTYSGHPIVADTEFCGEFKARA